MYVFLTYVLNAYALWKDYCKYKLLNNSIYAYNPRIQSMYTIHVYNPCM